ncbi:MAG: hypothetical protein JNK23_06690 [Opitutaceae bacterium]|nr:hypothetical protein [Opitutaceae bacterium]
MKTYLVTAFIALAFVQQARAQIPVTDVASIANSQLAQTQNIAKWVESINNLRTQINQLNQQINIQDDIRKWTGSPTQAGAGVILDVLGEQDLARDYGRAKDAVVGLARSLQSLQNTADGNYRAINSVDLNGNELQRDPLTFRRYSVLDAKQENTALVVTQTQDREKELQTEVALTLGELKAAETDAEVQKLSAKLTALNGQLAQVDAARRREVDEVALQKIANDSRLEQERQAAAEMESRDAYLSNQRVTDYMKTLKLRRTKP